MAKPSRRILTGLGLVLLLLIAGGPAAQAVYSGTGMPRATFTTQRPAYGTQWNGVLNTSEGNWNLSAVVNISTTTGSVSTNPNTVRVGSYSGDWYGTYTRTYSGGPVAPGYRFAIRLNTATIDRDAVSWTQFARSVYTHELGHALNLAHRPSSSIMHTNRNRNTVWLPTTSDRANVTNHYS